VVVDVDVVLGVDELMSICVLVGQKWVPAAAGLVSGPDFVMEGTEAVVR
jgi:hypothetical protein